MAIPTLSGSYIDETYHRLVQVSGSEFADGDGNLITFGQTPTGSLLVTASASGNTITFIKGDGNPFSVTVSGGSGDTTGFITTGSFNSFTSSINSFTQSILNWTGSVVTNTNFNSFTSSYNTGSFTGSFTGSLKGTADTASYYAETDPVYISQKPTLATTGSNTFRGNQTVTGSLFTSGSNTLIGTTTLTGSLLITGSTTQVGNNNLLGNTTLSGSIIISGSVVDSTIQIYGNTKHNGYIRFDPVATNIDQSISASYIYVSGSTNDLYFTQNGQGYNNTTRLRWLEGNLYTGLLNGGIITATIGSNTYQVSSGSGIIVTMNASYNDNPYPTIKYINWGNLTKTIDALSASYDQQFVAIDSSSNIYAQGTPYSDGDYNTKIPIGIVIHQNHSTINAVQTFPSVAYGWKQRSYDFVKAFGPLKISGYSLTPSSSLGLLLSGGTAWVDGRNYVVDPNTPSYIVEATGITTSKIYRYYQSGSLWHYDTNNGLGYTTIDPTKYSNNGVLSSVPVSNWSIQRVFYFPNSATKAFYVYYGNAVYPNKTETIAAITTETFTEAPNTAANAIFVGYVLVRNNADFTNSTTYDFISSGLFRSSGTGGAAGAGGGVTTLAALTDVSLASLTNGDLLMYSGSKWINTKTLSGSYTLSGSLTTNGIISVNSLTASIVSASQFTGSLFGTASWATNAQTASFLPVGVYAITASWAQSASNAVNAETASTADNFTVRGNLIVSGNTTIGDATTDTITMNAATMSLGSGTGILNIDSNTLYVDGANNRVGIKTSNPVSALSISDKILFYDNTLPGTVNTRYGILFYTGSINNATGGLVIEASASEPNDPVLTLGVGHTQFGNRNTGAAAGMLRIDTRPTERKVIINSIPSGSTTLTNRFSVDLQNGNTLIAPVAGNVAIGKTTANATLDVNGNTIITGSLIIVTGSSVEFQVLNTGVNIGSIITDIHSVTGSLRVSGSITGSLSGSVTGRLFGTASWASSASFAINATTALTSSYPITVAGTTLYSINPLSSTTPSPTDNIFLGSFAGRDIFESDIIYSNFIGYTAGYSASKSDYSNFIGYWAGREAYNSPKSVGIGYYAGAGSNNSSESVAIGPFAGGTFNSRRSVYVGCEAGYNQFNTPYSIFIGYRAGWRSGAGSELGPNNIIIGNNISFTPLQQNSINIGGILFGTDCYSNALTQSINAQTMGKIGVNTLPSFNFQVSGSVAFTDLTPTAQTDVVTIDTATGQLYYTASSAIGGGGPITSNTSSIATGGGTFTVYDIDPTSYRYCGVQYYIQMQNNYSSRSGRLTLNVPVSYDYTSADPRPIKLPLIDESTEYYTGIDNIGSPTFDNDFTTEDVIFSAYFTGTYIRIVLTNNNPTYTADFRSQITLI